MGIQALGNLGSGVTTAPDSSATVPSVPVATPPPVVQAPVPQTPQPQAPTNAQVEQAAKQVQSMMQANSVGLEFSVDHSSGRTVTKVIDTQTSKVVLQIPSEESLAIAQAINEWQGMRQGLLIKQKV